MSMHAVEVVLYRLANQPDDLARFMRDRDSYLGEYRLANQELEALRGFDVERLAEMNVNWMLLMGAYQALHGRPKQPEYLHRIRGYATRPAASVVGEN